MQFLLVFPALAHQKLLHNCPHRPRQVHTGGPAARDHQHDPQKLLEPISGQAQSGAIAGHHSSSSDCLHALRAQGKQLPTQFGGHSRPCGFPLLGRAIHAWLPGRSAINRCDPGNPGADFRQLRAGQAIEPSGNSSDEQDRHDLQHPGNLEGDRNLAPPHNCYQSQCQNRSQCRVNTQ